MQDIKKEREEMGRQGREERALGELKAVPVRQCTAVCCRLLLCFCSGYLWMALKRADGQTGRCTETTQNLPQQDENTGGRRGKPL